MARGGRAAIAVLIAAAMAVLLAALSFAPEASAEEREPEYQVSYYALDCSESGDTGVYAGWDRERDGRPVEVCTKPGYEPVKYESQCLFGGVWRADLGGGSCLYRISRAPACLAPLVVDENGTCWFQLTTNLHVPPVVDPIDEGDGDEGDGDGDDAETEPPSGEGNGEGEGGVTDNDASEDDDEDETLDDGEQGDSVPTMPVCIEHAMVQDNPDAAGLAVGDTFAAAAGGGTYVIVAGDINGCSFGCIDGWDANCDGRIGDFCLSEHNRFTVFGVWQCLRHLASGTS